MKQVLLAINKIINLSSYLCVAALFLMVVNIFIDVVVRYVVFGLFQDWGWIEFIDWYNAHLPWLGGVGMQELEWHFFSAIFLLGLGFTLRDNGHVRVDIFYDNFSRKTQAWINILGGLIFALPFSMLMLYFGYDFFFESYTSMEDKGDPGSLPRLWPGKLLIVLAFFFLILSIVAVILNEILVIKNDNVDVEGDVA